MSQVFFYYYLYVNSANFLIRECYIFFLVHLFVFPGVKACLIIFHLLKFFLFHLELWLIFPISIKSSVRDLLQISLNIISMCLNPSDKLSFQTFFRRHHYSSLLEFICSISRFEDMLSAGTYLCYHSRKPLHPLFPLF